MKELTSKHSINSKCCYLRIWKWFIFIDYFNFKKLYFNQFKLALTRNNFLKNGPMRMQLFILTNNYSFKAMAIHSSTLAWKIPWTEEPHRLLSMGSWRIGQDGASSLSLFTFMHWRRKWQPTPVCLPGESQGWEPGGPPSMGSHRVGHDWRDLAAVCHSLIFVFLRFFPCSIFR